MVLIKREVTTNASDNINIEVGKSPRTAYGYQVKVQVSTNKKNIITENDNLIISSRSSASHALSLKEKGITGVNYSVCNCNGEYMMEIEAFSGTDIKTPRKSELKITIRSLCKIKPSWNENQQKLYIRLESPFTL